MRTIDGQSYVGKAPDIFVDARGFGVLYLFVIERHLEGKAAQWGFGGW